MYLNYGSKRICYIDIKYGLQNVCYIRGHVETRRNTYAFQKTNADWGQNSGQNLS